MSKKKKHHEEHEEHVNHEAWVIPYADMLTLLMALFLVMWATSQVDVNKAREVAAGFADSLTTVFLYATPLIIVAFGLTWLLREVPLRSTVRPDDPARELAVSTATGIAEPDAV